MMKRLMLLFFVVLFPTLALAQAPPVLVLGNDGGVTRPIKVSSDGTVQTNAGSGSGASTTDPDDDTIAFSQTNDNANSFMYASNGSAWKRLMFGSAGTAATTVLSVQGIASGTALSVSSATLATAANQSTLITSNAAIQTAVELANSQDVAHDAADTGNPVKIGGYAKAAAPSAVSADADRVNAWFTRVGALATNATDGTNLEVLDPCSTVAKTTDPVSITGRGVIIAATASKKNYICSLSIVHSAAISFNISEGTGTTCQTSEAAIVGSLTEANGMPFAANGGGAWVGGNATVIAGKGTNVDLCIVPSGAGTLAGFVTWVQR